MNVKTIDFIKDVIESNNYDNKYLELRYEDMKIWRYLSIRMETKL